MATESQILSSLSPVYAHLLFCRGSSLRTSTSVENALQISPFYRKQTQFAGCPNELKVL